jgi:hypothetical protein
VLALALGCALGFGIAFAALRTDRARSAPITSDEEIGARATEILNNGKDPLGRVTEFSALLPTLGPTAAPALVKAIEASPLDGGDPEFVLLGMWWARFDPQAAMAWTATERRAQYATVIAGIIRSWAHSDPAAALAAARGLPSQGQQELAIDAAIAGWDESGAPGLLERVADLQDRDQQRLAASVARRRVLSLGPEGAFRWVESLEAAPPFREMIAVRVASASAEVTGGGAIAAAWATPRVRSDDRLSGYPRRIATRWVAKDPEAAMAWLATLPAGADRSDGVAEAFRAWAIRDYRAAFEWIEKAELQPWNEPALAIYARAIANDHPKEAIEHAQRISDPELREGTMIVVGQIWTSKDREAASAWLAQPGIPERVRRVSAMVGESAPARKPAPVADQRAPMGGVPD